AASTNPEDMNRIASIVNESGARLQSIYPLRKEGEKRRLIVVRFETDKLDTMVKLFEHAGFTVLEKNFQGNPVTGSNDD
ncbi:MAG: hypothetical protein V3S21_01705, partial [Xanthomonadales bacterium]